MISLMKGYKCHSIERERREREREISKALRKSKKKKRVGGWVDE